MKLAAFLLGLLLFTFQFPSIVHAQSGAAVRWLFFADKGPQELYAAPDLSCHAVARRIRLDIPFDRHDRPVYTPYLDSLRNCGAKVRTVSRWLNAATVEADDETWGRIPALPFVRETAPIHVLRLAGVSDQLSAPGQAARQLDAVCLQELHANGWTGQGVRVAVIDDGYWSVDQHEAFAALRNENRLLGHYDFPNREADVFNQGTHGLRVFSVMAAQLNGQYRGAAPLASYFLLHSEDGRMESRMEEDYWAAAAEWADSAGADLIQSSLVYNTFDNPATNYRYQDLDGQTATITRAAQRAASRGILVVNAAGNEGRTPWRYVAPPADGDSVLAVGSVNWQGFASTFSGVGPTFDGRIKPDVAAPGEGVIVLGSAGELGGATGTSFSAPLVAGLAACLMQAAPSANPMQVIEALRKSGSRADRPDTLAGWGVPCGPAALRHLWGLTSVPEEKSAVGRLFPNPAAASWSLEVPLEDSALRWRFDWYDGAGRLHWSETRTLDAPQALIHWSRSETPLGAGFYHLHCDNGRRSFWVRGVVLQ